jgi:hypothetical protein
MIICPHCHHIELQGAIICSECGSRLPVQALKQTNFLSFPSQDAFPQPLVSEPVITVENRSREDKNCLLALELLDSLQTIQLCGNREYTIGRSSPGQQVLPDIDLTPYQAFALGVSRMHAVLKTRDDYHVIISDLDSSNGTRINGQRIISQTDHELKNGDLLALGKFRIRIHITG